MFISKRYSSAIRQLLWVAASLLAANAAHAQIYALKTVASATSGNSNQSYISTINANNATPTVVSTSTALTHRVLLDGEGYYTDGLAIVGSGAERGALYAFTHTDIDFNVAVPTTGSAQLVSIDPLDGTATAIGSARSGAIISGAAFDMQGQLWVLNKLAIALEQISTTDGSVISSVPITINGAAPSAGIANSNLGDIAFDADGNGYVSGGGVFREIDTTSGDVTDFVSIGSGLQFNGLAFYRDNKAFILQGTNTDELRYSPSPDFAPLTNAIANLTSATGVANSGPMDLAAIPNKVIAVDDDSSTHPALHIAANGTTGPVAILSNDSDVQGEALALDATTPIVTPPANGTVTVSGNTVSYTPNADFIGNDSFTYSVCTSESEICTQATVNVTVSANGPVLPTPQPVPALGGLGMVFLSTALGILGMRRRTWR